MADELISSVVLLVSSIAMLLLAYTTWRYARSMGRVTIVIDLIFYFVFVKLALYYLLPTLLRFASNYQFEREDGVAVGELSRLYSIELVSWFAWATGLVCALRLMRGSAKRMPFAEFLVYRYADAKVLMIVIACGFITTQVAALAGVGANPVFEVFRSLFFFVGLPLGPFLIVMSTGYLGTPLLLLGVVSSLLSVLSLSTRGALVYLVLFGVFLVWFVKKKRLAKFIIVGTTVVLVSIYFVLGGLLAGSIVIDDTGRISLTAGVGQDKKGARTSWQDIEWRFGAATRMGTKFLELYDRGEGAGIQPIRNSFLGFLPRSINPQKPHPSTLNGDDIYSQGMYVISREINGYNTYSMVEFPTGAHFYWEFGIPGVMILSLISGLYIAVCAQTFSKLGVVAIPLMVATFKPWGFMDPKIWVSDIVLQIYQVILPLLVLVVMVRYARAGVRVLTPRNAKATLPLEPS